MGLVSSSWRRDLCDLTISHSNAYYDVPEPYKVSRKGKSNNFSKRISSYFV